MKKSVALILALMMILLTLSACGDSQDDSVKGSTTLMIYMIGSDLESKSGAATDDLIEIQDSGVDLDKCDVVVYTGGSDQWQNDQIDSEKNAILTLTADGFDTEETLEQVSMGEAETLTEFLDYCVKNHPADHYALILWDHGNGPLIGYGKDTLYSNDSLNLSEMKEALDSSSFKEKEHLDWVGFDACLMASAELSCIWSPYADYMVSSQEIEPAFGWNYSFLDELGKKDTKELLTGVTDEYLSACKAYYEEKGYTDRDITLSCVDLSCAGELEEALNGLFAAAAADVEGKFDQLSAKRVNTRALGRASTGSEYDLVDVGDLSEQLKDAYPQETKTLTETLGKMVISNATDAEGLCGLSLYYPFYNKSYFENSWNETYQEMGVFSAYLDYLSKYQEKWLGTELQDEYATSETPKEESESQYSLKLTDEQEQHFASAKYYIMKKEGKETFSKVYSSSDVELKDGKLVANFDGNIIYAHNELDDYLIPVTTEYDTVGENTNYSVKIELDSSQGGSFLTAGLSADQQDVQFLHCRYLIAANKNSGEIAVSALMPENTEESGTDLLGGKTEEIDISNFTTYLFMSEDRRTITRTDNNVVKGVDEWLPSDNHLWDEWSVADGLDFVYAPLGYGEYSLFFEICDTQGSLYCSEPIDVNTDSVDWLKTEEKKTTTVESDGTYPLLLKEDDNFALYLDKVKDDDRDYLTFTAENKSDKKLRYSGKNVCCNDTVSCSDGYTPSTSIEPGKKEQAYSDYKIEGYEDLGIEEKPLEFNFGDAMEIGALKELTSLSFDVTVTGYEDKKTVWKSESFVINFKKGAEFPLKEKYSFSEPLLDRELEAFNGAVVKPQILVDEDVAQIELLCFGMDGGNLRGAYRFTSKTDEGVLCLATDGIAIDDVFLDTSNQLEVQPMKTEYRSFYIPDYDLEDAHITGIQKLVFSFRSGSSSSIVWQGYGDVDWHEAKLDKQSSAPTKFTPGSETLLDENGVKIALVGYEYDKDSPRKTWTFSLEADNEEGAEVNMIDLNVNGTDFANNYDWAPVYLYRAHTGPGQKRYFEISTSSLSTGDITVEDLSDVSFRFAVYSFTGEKLLFEGKDTVSLKAE